MRSRDVNVKVSENQNSTKKEHWGGNFFLELHLIDIDCHVEYLLGLSRDRFSMSNAVVAHASLLGRRICNCLKLVLIASGYDDIVDLEDHTTKLCGE